MAELLQTGDNIIDIDLEGADGKRYSTAQARQSGLLLFVFFKVNCPTCQLALPYFERLHRAYQGLTVWGVSENEREPTLDFARQYGCTFPMLLDYELDFTVAYGLRAVPTAYLVDASGTVLWSVESWHREKMNELSRLVAGRLGAPETSIVPADDPAPAMKPG